MENSYIKKSETIMHSFIMPCKYTVDNLAMVKQACTMRVDEINAEVAESNKDSQEKGFSIRHHCNVWCDVKEGVDNIRVNVHGGTAKDAMMIGYNFCMLQMNPSLRDKPAKSDQ